MILTPVPNLEVNFELYDKDIDSDDFLGRLVESLLVLHEYFTKCIHIPQIHSCLTHIHTLLYQLTLVDNPFPSWDAV